MNQDSAPDGGAMTVPKGTQIAEYSPVEAGLADLRQRFQGVVFDLATTKGDKEARAARHELVKTRTSLEALRKNAKASLLERGRLLDTEAARIKGEIVALEEPIDTMIKLDEARREQERAAREAVEQARVAAIRARIAEITGAPLLLANAGVQDICDELLHVRLIEIDEVTFGEFVDEAEGMRLRAVSQLETLRDAAMAREDAAAKLKAEQAELDRQREAIVAEAARQQAAQQAYEAAVKREVDAREEAARAQQAKELEERKRLAVVAKAERDALVAELARQRDAFEEERRVANAAALAETAKLREAQAVAQAEIDAEKTRLAEVARVLAQETQEHADQAAAKDAEQVAAKAAIEADAQAEAGAAERARLEHEANRRLLAAVVAAPVASEQQGAVAGTPHYWRPTDTDLLESLAESYDVSVGVALEWIKGFNVEAQETRLGSEMEAA